MKYNKSEIMKMAWKIVRNGNTISNALKMAWNYAKEMVKKAEKKMTVGKLVEKMQAAIKSGKDCYSSVSVFIGRKMYTFKNFDKLANMFGDKIITGRNTEKDGNGGYELAITVK